MVVVGGVLHMILVSQKSRIGCPPSPQMQETILGKCYYF